MGHLDRQEEPFIVMKRRKRRGLAQRNISLRKWRSGKRRRFPKRVGQRKRNTDEISSVCVTGLCGALVSFSNRRQQKKDMFG